MVARDAVNIKVGGSNPSRGVKIWRSVLEVDTDPRTRYSSAMLHP